MRAAQSSGLFVTGTDTGVGKTLVALALIRGLVRQGRRVAAMKPVAAGATLQPVGGLPSNDPLTAATQEPVVAGANAAAANVATERPTLRNDDALRLAAAANVAAPYATLNPYCFAAPVSPHIAAEDAGIRVDPELICREFGKLRQLSECVIVEGAGGWLAPISRTQTMEAVARALDLPVVLVVGLRLGCLNHALLTAQAVRSSGLRLAHWVANAIEPQLERAAENISLLSAALGPPLAVVPHSLHSADAAISVSL